MKFSDNEVRILHVAMGVMKGHGDHTALTYEEWCQAEALFSRLDASGNDIDAALAA